MKKEKIVIVIRGGCLVGVYSSIPDKVVEIELVDHDSREGARRSDEYVDKLIESGETPYTLF